MDSAYTYSKVQLTNTSYEVRFASIGITQKIQFAV